LKLLALIEQIKDNEIGGPCSMYGGEKNTCKILVRKSPNKGPFGRRRGRCEGDITMGQKETEWERVDWINLPLYRTAGRLL
jgi:hypothetical protein